jgi:excisionase family DNA binding protein
VSAGNDRNGRIVPRLTLSKQEAAMALGVSVDYFEQHVMPDLRVIHRGRRRLIPSAELERWIDRSASRVGGRR